MAVKAKLDQFLRILELCQIIKRKNERTQLTLRPLLTLGCVLINLRRLVQQES